MNTENIYPSKLQRSGDKKKILYLITQSELGGAQIYVFDLIFFVKDKYEIEVAFGEQGESGELAKKLKDIEIKYHIIPNLKRNISKKDDLLAFFQIRKLIKAIKPDIIHLNSSKISILGSLASIFLNTKVVYTVHGWVFNEPVVNAEFYKRAERFTAKFKDEIICVSEFDKQTALKEKICEERKLITVHNGIKKIDFLNKETARQEIKKLIPQFEINENNIWIGSVGNLYKTKGFEYLINAAKIITDYNSNFKFIIIGKNSGEKEELQNIINQLRLEKNIILTGQITEASKLLKAFDLYVCSSVKEGLSYTVIEAMAAQLPIIATRVGGNEELIDNEQTGILIESQNTKQLAQSIINTIANPELMNYISVNAQKKALEQFTIDLMIKKTDEVYEKILNTK